MAREKLTRKNLILDVGVVISRELFASEPSIVIPEERAKEIASKIISMLESVGMEPPYVHTVGERGIGTRPTMKRAW